MNTPIYTIIVDDLAASINTLCKDLVNYPEIEVLEATTSLEKAKKAILKYQPNLLFLDVEMPKQTGLDFLQKISLYVHPGMCVVFYSAFDKYMIDALRSSAFDYLLKPYQPEELDYIIGRVKEKLHSGQVNFGNFKLRLSDSDKKFALQTLTGLVLLNRLEVLYFQYSSESRSWQLIHTNFSTHKLHLNTTSKDILNLNSSFVQVSKDCIVNIEYLSSIENKSYRCSLYPPFQKIEIYASRRYYSLLKETLEIL